MRVGCSQPALEVVVLHRADRAIPVVVQHKELHGQIKPSQGLELLDVELKTAITVDANSPPPTAGQATADRRGNAGAHRPDAGHIVDALARLDLEGLHQNVAARARAARRDHIIAA